MWQGYPSANDLVINLLEGRSFFCLTSRRLARSCLEGSCQFVSSRCRFLARRSPFFVICSCFPTRLSYPSHASLIARSMRSEVVLRFHAVRLRWVRTWANV